MFGYVCADSVVLVVVNARIAVRRLRLEPGKLVCIQHTCALPYDVKRARTATFVLQRLLRVISCLSAFAMRTNVLASYQVSVLSNCNVFGVRV